jgi:hypothetical protein
MRTARSAAILAVAILVGACGETPPSPDTAASMGATCDADFTVTGGYDGRVTGSIDCPPLP